MRILIFLTISALMGIACKSKQAAVDSPDQVVMNPENRGDRGPKDGGRTQGRATMDPDQIIATLELDETQEVQFLEIWESNQEKMKALRDSSQGDRSAMRTQMSAMREENENAIKAILTADQIKKYEEMVTAMRGKGGDRRGRQ